MPAPPGPVRGRLPRTLPGWVPAQHGAWGLLGWGLALAWIAAGGGGLAGLAVTVAVIAGFIACHNATARGRRRRRQSVPAGGVALVALGLAGAAGAPWAAAAPFALAAILGLAAGHGLHRRGPRARLPLVLSTCSLGAATTGAALAAGAAPATAAAAGGLLALQGLSRLFAVRGLVRGGPTGRRTAWAAGLAALVIVSATAWATPASPWCAIAFVPGLLVTAWLGRSATGPGTLGARRIGRYELAAGAAFMILTGIGLAPR